MSVPFVLSVAAAAGTMYLMRRKEGPGTYRTPVDGDVSTTRTWEDYTTYDDRKHMKQWLGYRDTPSSLGQRSSADSGYSTTTRRVDTTSSASSSSDAL